MADFLTALQTFESGDRRHPERGGTNIANTHQGTSSGQAQGYNQITTGTWREFGGLAYAPDALHATREQQNAIAAKIPLRRWAPETLDYLKSQGFSLNRNATLADNISLNHGMSLASVPAGVHAPPHTLTPPTAGVPYTAEAVAAANPPPAVPPPPTFGESIAKGDVGGALKAALTRPAPTKDAQGNTVEGKSPLEKLGDTIQGQKQAPAIPEMQQAAAAQDPDPGLAPAAQQLFSTVQAAAAKPLTWGARPYGSNAGFQGTTLNQTSYGGGYG